MKGIIDCRTRTYDFNDMGVIVRLLRGRRRTTTTVDIAKTAAADRRPDFPCFLHVVREHGAQDDLSGPCVSICLLWLRLRRHFVDR